MRKFRKFFPRIRLKSAKQKEKPIRSVSLLCPLYFYFFFLFCLSFLISSAFAFISLSSFSDRNKQMTRYENANGTVNAIMIPYHVASFLSMNIATTIAIANETAKAVLSKPFFNANNNIMTEPIIGSSMKNICIFLLESDHLSSYYEYQSEQILQSDDRKEPLSPLRPRNFCKCKTCHEVTGGRCEDVGDTIT